ncbi:MAG: hypothetical protein ACK5U7_08340 [Bacteroidota bacterium]|jgi:hypothetical protein
MIGLKQKLLKGVYVTGENDWYEVGSKLPTFTPFHKFRILEKRGLISEAPLDESIGDETTPLDDEVVETALETPTIDETPKPQAKGKKK